MSMGTDVPRYLVRVKGCYYWRPTPRMAAAGFQRRTLGKDEVHAKREAIRLNAEWDRYRRGTTDESELMVYPPGSLGEAFNRALALRAAERKSKGKSWNAEQRSRDDWPRAWKWIGPTFGDYDPMAVQAEDLMALRAKVAERVSESEAHRVIKVWRALWKKLKPLKYRVDPNADPSRLFSNSAPDPRQEVWSHKEVLKLSQRAWREGYFGLCAAIAVGWDTMLSPVDIRELRVGQLVTDDTGDVFILDRAKSGRAAAATLTAWSEAILNHYVLKLPFTLTAETPIFWTRGYKPGAKGGRPRPPRPYNKDRMSGDFAVIRQLVFGTKDTRQLQDMRRSGAGEALVGGATPHAISAKMANTLSHSNRLHRTYLPVDVATVRKVDELRVLGRKRTKEAQKVPTQPRKKFQLRVTDGS